MNSGELLQEIINIQKEMEEQVKKHGSMLQQYKFSAKKYDVFLKVFADMPLPCFLFDADSKIAFANRLLCSLTGISADDFKDRKENIFSYLDQESAAKFQAAVNGIFNQNPESYYYEVSPVSISARGETREKASAFSKAILYPLYDESERVAFGAAVFLYEKL